MVLCDRLGNTHLDTGRPAFTLEARHEKNRQGAQIPLRADLAADIAAWLALRLKVTQEAAEAVRQPVPALLPADMPVFNIPRALRKVLDRDLAFAGIPKRDDRGRVVDVHSLRYTFCSHLAAAGVPLRTAQAAMRHSDPKLTANIYTDPALLDVNAALEALPEIPLSRPEDGHDEAASQSGETGAEKCPPKRPPFAVKRRPNLSISCNSAPGCTSGTDRRIDTRKAPETGPVDDAVCRGMSGNDGGRYWNRTSDLHDVNVAL